MLIFHKITWKNFLGTGNSAITLELDKAKNTILTGISGSGKSTLLDAISFGLFNKPFRNINKNNLVNAINQKDCLVEITFSISDKVYKIKRGIKPTLFEIYCNDVLMDQDSQSRDYQKFLEKNILKVSHKAFMQVVMLGASNFRPFMLLKPAERRMIIEELLDIEIFSIMNILLKQKINTSENDIENYNSKIELLSEKIKIQKKYLDDLKRDKNELIEKIKNKIEDSSKQIIQIDEKIKRYEEQILSLKESQRKLQFNSEQLMDLQKNKTKITTIINNENKLVQFYTDHDDCPTCKQGIEHTFKEKELKDKNELIKKLQNKISEIDAQIQKHNIIKQEHEKYNNEIQDINFALSKESSSRKEIQKYKIQFEKEVQQATVEEHKNEEVLVIIKQLNQELQDIESLLLQKKNNIQLYETGLSLLKDQGIKTQIIKQYLPLINKFTNNYLNQMSFFVKFEIDENFDESIKSRHRDEFCYGNFSDGEKQRLDLALLFTWREIAKLKNSVNTNLLILDEIADSYLDNETTDNIINLLKSETFKDLNIFVISHKSQLVDKFENCINFTKEKLFSKIS